MILSIYTHRQDGVVMHAFLLIGQSNMAGRGYLDQAKPIDTERIYTLRNGRWQRMFRPINPDRSFSGVSLAESFAEAYSKKYNVDVGLICCADGGTSIDQWIPGSLLFDNAVYQAKLASRTSRIAGILWHQGESDCTAELYPQYREKLITVIDGFRKELDLYDIPFIMGGLGEYLAQFPMEYFPEINAIANSITETSPMTGFVSAEGLTSNPDNLHFSAESLYTFGLRYFREYEKLRKPDFDADAGNCIGDTKRSALELL